MKKFISKLLFLFFFLSTYSFSTAQIINSYARITAVAGTTITISGVAAEVNETAGIFTVGDRVIVMQMQDDVIGTTGNNAGFGNIGTIASAGLYEISTITARTGTSITLATLVNTFNTGANSSLQLISFPTFCSRGATTGLTWTGRIGGVIAFRCAGTLTLTGSINANGIGFRGGSVSANFENGCFDNPYRSNDGNYGEKGESIHLRTANNQQYGVARLTNGGGGGVSHNGGGGGGGNMTAGGTGGVGYDGSAAGCPAPGAGGYGGLALFPYVNLNRVFMGGGGGGANQNNSYGTSGANGGGIVIIEAVQLITPNTCGGTPIQITANGNNSGNTTGGGNDASGGAGAGGSIVFRVNIISINALCPLQNQARGGLGGTANFATTHAGGGGGGRGLILFASGCNNNIPNLVADANIGAGGCNNNSSPCNSQAGGGSTIGSDGIICDALLPIEWLSLDATYKDNQSIIDWKTTIDKELDYFVMERSTNGKDWKKIGKIMSYQTVASSHSTLDYQFIDKEWVAQITYYRINQFDKNGSSQYSPVVSVNPKRTGELTIYPNPAKDKLYISYLNQNKPIQTTIISSIGKVISTSQLENNQPNKQEIELNITNLSAGIYLLSIQLENGEIINHKFVVEK